MKTLAIVRQATPVLLGALAVEILVGGLFGRMKGALEALPGLLVLVPAILALCGNINVALASRLSSALHIGSFDAHEPDRAALRREVLAAAGLGAFMGGFAGAGAHLLTTSLGFASAGLLVLTVLGAVVVSASALVVAYVTTRAVLAAFRRGTDPDNVSGSFVLTTSDLATMTLLVACVGGWLAWQ